MPRELFFISNLLSLARLLSAPFLFILLAAPTLTLLPLAPFAAFIIATDFLDGALARRLDQTSRLGLLLDPLADKAALFAASLALLVSTRISLLLFVVLVAKDLLIMVGGFFLVRRTRVVPASNALGKWTTVALSFGIALLALLEASGLESAVLFHAGRIILVAGMVLALVSLAGYAVAMRLALGQKPARAATALLYGFCLTLAAPLAVILLTATGSRWL